MIAHQGGWDELLLPALVVALVLLVPAWRRRARAGRDDEGVPDAAPDPGECRYCGAEVREGEARCPRCGFRSAS